MARTTEITYRRKTGIGLGAPGFKKGCIISVPDEGTELRSIRKSKKWIEERRGQRGENAQAEARTELC